MMCAGVALPPSPPFSPTHIGAAGPSPKPDAPPSASGDNGGALPPAAWVLTRIEMMSMYEYSDLLEVKDDCELFLENAAAAAAASGGHTGELHCP